MVLVNDNWEQVYNLQDISKIIRENYNEDLADELDKLIPEHSKEEYEGLRYDFDLKCEKISELEDEISSLESGNGDLENKIEELEKQIESLEDEIYELKLEH